MHRIGPDVAAPGLELDLDDNEVVNVLEIFADTLLGVPCVASSDDEIASGANPNLAGNMAGKSELAFSPLDLDLVGD